jgi:hypothetical protein
VIYLINRGSACPESRVLFFFRIISAGVPSLRSSHFVNSPILTSGYFWLEDRGRRDGRGAHRRLRLPLPTDIKSELLEAAQHELMKRHWDNFCTLPLSIAEGGKGVIVPGCAECRKLLYKSNQHVSHLALDVLPEIIDRSTDAGCLGNNNFRLR